MRFGPSMIVVLALVAVCESRAFAHRLLLECRIKDDRIRVEAFYDDDTPAQQAKVFIENAKKVVVAEGRTDERGLWSCALLKSGIYTIRAESVGHAATKTFIIAEASSLNPFRWDEASMNDSETTANFESSSISNDGPPRSGNNREQATKTPWLQVIIGLAIIGVLCALFVLFKKQSINSDG